MKVSASSGADRPIFTEFGFLLGSTTPKLLERLSGAPGEYRSQPLYHYTSADGLKGILGTGTLWATDAAYANDPDETTYGRRILPDALEHAECRNPRTRRLLSEIRSRLPHAPADASEEAVSDPTDRSAFNQRVASMPRLVRGDGEPSAATAAEVVALPRGSMEHAELPNGFFTDMAALTVARSKALVS